MKISPPTSGSRLKLWAAVKVGYATLLSVFFCHKMVRGSFFLLACLLVCSLDIFSSQRRILLQSSLWSKG